MRRFAHNLPVDILYASYICHPISISKSEHAVLLPARFRHPFHATRWPDLFGIRGGLAGILPRLLYFPLHSDLRTVDWYWQMRCIYPHDSIVDCDKRYRRHCHHGAPDENYLVFTNAND